MRINSVAIGICFFEILSTNTPSGRKSRKYGSVCKALSSPPPPASSLRESTAISGIRGQAELVRRLSGKIGVDQKIDVPCRCCTL